MGAVDASCWIRSFLGFDDQSRRARRPGGGRANVRWLELGLGEEVADRRRNSGSGCGAPSYPVSHGLPVWCPWQQPAHVYADGRAKLHSALWVRLHLPAWMAGLVVGASGIAQLS